MPRDFIINSLLDTDLYKLTMMQAVFHQFPDATVEYKFVNRTQHKVSPEHGYLNFEIDHLCTLRFTEQELEYFRTLGLFTEDFIEYLKDFTFTRSNIVVHPEHMTIVGKWLETILFEVPILAIYSQLSCERQMVESNNTYFSYYEDQNNQDLILCNKYGLKFVDFGTRRRFSRWWHGSVISVFKDHVIGTSNVLFAKEFGLKPVGTMAHEWIQAGQALYPLHEFQKRMLYNWKYEYGNRLSIALTDTINIEAFLHDFDSELANLYGGVRQDSGNPEVVADRVIEHYRNLGIDPMTKTIIFSDGLTFEKMMRLKELYENKINVSFGIGTNFTNSIDGIDPQQIVIKMVKLNGKPVIKLSDTPGKTICINKAYKSMVVNFFEGGYYK